MSPFASAEIWSRFQKPGAWIKSILVLALLLACSQKTAAQEELSVEASWAVPTEAKFVSAVSDWLDEINASDDIRGQVQQTFNDQRSQPQQAHTIDEIMELISIAEDNVRPLLNAIKSDSATVILAEYQKMASENVLSGFTKRHTALLTFRWLVQNRLYDESLELLEQSKIGTETVLDPATLLFYRGTAQHQLFQQEESAQTLDQLLENEAEIPRRFSVLANLMNADIQQVESDSLDEIARMMSDVERRQRLYRSGKRVREEEQAVIQKLDKIIEEIEQQQQQQQQQSGNQPPSQPMQNSRNAKGRGAGDVKNRNVQEGGSWGNLPAAQRAAALTEMTEDLPPHYRTVIEAYFRKLASEQDQ